MTKLSELVSTLADNPALARSFTADPITTLRSLDMELSPEELKTAAKLDTKTLMRIGSLKKSLEEIDPGLLEDTGNIIY